MRTSGWGKGDGAHPGDIVDDAVDDFALARLEHDSAIPCSELSLAVTGNDHTIADVRDGDGGEDETELARAGALDVRVEFRLEVLMHARPEVGRVKHDRVRELSLRKPVWRRKGSWKVVSERTREGGQGIYDEEHRLKSLFACRRHCLLKACT